MGWTEHELIVLEHFFTNSDRPIFALRNMHPAIQNYVYAGISRFPNVRERLLRILAEKGALEAAADAAKAGRTFEDAAGDVMRFAAERNRAMYFEMRHGSSAEGASVFVVSENNPIYATEEQQDFYWPMTTMELSTRYATKFGIDRVYWEPGLMQSQFAEELKENIKRSFSLYARGFAPMMKAAGRLQSSGLSTKISALDATRFCIPLAAYTTLILGGNARSVIEHFRKMLSSDDTFVNGYARAAFEELSKVSPGFFEGLQPDPHPIERNRRLREYAERLFHGKFEPVAGEVRLFYNLPPEETALAQIIYPYCTVPFERVYDTVSGFGENERRELFGLATSGRQNRSSPMRGFETRHLIYEIETAWALWKDFKRNRMNLRFHQDARGLAGWATPALIAESPELAKEYGEAQRKTSELMEKIYVKFGRVARAAATQGSKKRFLLCMGPRQLTVLGELRTCGEGDRGYRRIASRMIELAKGQNPRLFGHIVDNYKNAV